MDATEAVLSPGLITMHSRSGLEMTEGDFGLTSLSLIDDMEVLVRYAGLSPAHVMPATTSRVSCRSDHPVLQAFAILGLGRQDL